MTEFNLSEKIEECNCSKCGKGYIHDYILKSDVKEFIRLLRNTEIMVLGRRDRNKWWVKINKEIDKFAGDKLSTKEAEK
jgi:hypothetical protein